jgi:hypothetical protein
MLLAELFEPLKEGPMDDALEDLAREGDDALEDIAADYGVDPEQLKAKIGAFRAAKATMSNPTPKTTVVNPIQKPPSMPKKKAPVKHQPAPLPPPKPSKSWDDQRRERNEEIKKRDEEIWNGSQIAIQVRDKFARKIPTPEGFRRVDTDYYMPDSSDPREGAQFKRDPSMIKGVFLESPTIRIIINVEAMDLTSKFRTDGDPIIEICGHINYKKTNGKWYTMSRRGIDDSFSVGKYTSDRWSKNPVELVKQLVQEAQERINASQ